MEMILPVHLILHMLLQSFIIYSRHFELFYRALTLKLQLLLSMQNYKT